MRTDDFDYDLPPSRIAQQPPVERDGARMLVLDPRTGAVAHERILDLPQHLDAGDVLVLNDTRVLPARLLGRRASGAPAEILLLRETGPVEWEVLIRPARKLAVGAEVTFDGSPLRAIVTGDGGGETRRVRLVGDNPLAEVRRIGVMPTPPYIKATLQDPGRYQTVFARREGSAAAPTAGLHFTERLLRAVKTRGVSIVFITLHVGLDTFAPVREADPKAHRIHREAFSLSPDVVAAVAAARRRGGRVIAVGTTCVRVLESCATDEGLVTAQAGSTDLYILPGFRFRVVDALLTNFHLPRSTLLMLVSAFAGRERVLDAYREAIRLAYRFYSFGDCMLITERAAP
ncbi:MAG TPA: tRNA preQ1(34) S-adenosylmethionine ribosyltransferase-isomerase QueA [Candidatus Limnocylindrales bacterium]|nr:tRNA preQ1(34) S-adenosylmethionine ribosyltransferase-isomerase QueA [Candidatus Limnocylindrales bacterium]